MTFVYNKLGKPIAKGGCRDDGVMAFGIALQVDEIAPLEERARKAKILDLRGITEQAVREPEKVPIVTREEMCLATIMKKKAFKGENDVLGEVEEWL